MNVNLGCPLFCPGWLCVDDHPVDSAVAEFDVYDYLRSVQDLGCDVVYSKNLLEHLPDPGRFLVLCKGALRPGGLLHLVTDNGAWLPYYLPFSFSFGLGIGAHGDNAYSKRMNHSLHLQLFSVRDLANHLERAGLSAVSVKIQWRNLGARLESFSYCFEDGGVSSIGSREKELRLKVPSPAVRSEARTAW